MIRSKTFCKFFQVQSSFPLQSFFLRKKKDFRFNLGYKLASVSFHFTNILPNKKNWHKVSFINCQNYYFRWMKMDIAFLRNATNIWQKFLHSSRSYGTPLISLLLISTHITFLRNENHPINKSSHHRIITSPNYRIIKLSHQNPHFHHTNFHFLVSSFNVMV